MARILVVEDERLVRESMAVFLGLHYEVEVAADGRSGLDKVLRERPDLVVLDIGLPGLDGLEVCRQLRQRGFTAPVLFLTSRREELDTLTGFAVGGDDYIVKPVSLPLLEARVHAALRRAVATPSAFEEVHAWGSVRVNFTTHQVLVDGEPVTLSAKEMDLLRYMVRNRGVLLSREALLGDVWHYEADVSSRTVDTHILNLRRKLRDGQDGQTYIHTIRGRGYRFTG